MESFEAARPFAEVLKAHPQVNVHLSADHIDRLLDPADYVGLAGVFVDRAMSAK